MQPLSRNGPNVDSNLVLICANAHGNVHYLLTAIEKARGYEGIPTAVKRSYGPGVRAIALRGWEGYADDFLAGRLWREVELWGSDGLARHPGVPPFSWAARTADARALAELGSHELYVEWALERHRASSPSPSR
jgi:hypothetical protein